MALPTIAQQLSAFLQGFSPPLLHKKPKSEFDPWVFWSEDDEGSQNHSSSSSVDPLTLMLFHNFKSAFSELCDVYYLILQLWAPVTIGGKRLLSTSALPFAISHLDKNLKAYRLHSMKYRYNIDVNMQLCNIDEDEASNGMILSGGPSSAFLNRLPELVFLKHHPDSPLARYASECGLDSSLMLPICDTFQPSSCIAVLEVSVDYKYVFDFLQDMKRELEAVGLGVCEVQERIPYKAINSLKPVKEQIQAALKAICKSLDLDLAQVWIACDDENHLPSTSSLGGTQTKQMLALKLTGYFSDDNKELDYYYATCDVFSLKAGVQPVVKTLEDYEPRFSKNIRNLSNATLISNVADDETSALIICLRSIDTGDFNYAFEFMWCRSSDYESVIMLEAVLFALNRCLPSIKFASGEQLCDELHVIDVENSTDTEIKFLKIFQRNRVSPISDALEKGNNPLLVDHSARSEAKYKTAPKLLYQEEIKKQFGKTMKEAAENLNVSLSTLKRKCKDFGISEWQGRPKVVKRKAIDSCNYQSNRNEDDNGAIQEPSVEYRNENTLTIKALYGDDMIKFTIHISETTFNNVEKEIGKGFKMNHETYKLKYFDEDKDLILLTSDQGMSDCIKSMKILGQTVVRIYVIPFTQ